MEEEVVVEVPEEVAVVAEPVVEAVVEALVPVLEEVKALADEMRNMKKDFEAFKKEPATKKITNGKENFNKAEEAINDRVAAIMALRNK